MIYHVKVDGVVLLILCLHSCVTVGLAYYIPITQFDKVRSTIGQHFFYLTVRHQRSHVGKV